MSETIETINGIEYILPDTVTLYGGPLDGVEVRVESIDYGSKFYQFVRGGSMYTYETRWEMSIGEMGERRCTYSLVWPEIPWNPRQEK
jgi:hypothetical protein